MGALKVYMQVGVLAIGEESGQKYNYVVKDGGLDCAYLPAGGRGESMLRCHIQVSDWRGISSCCHSHRWQCNTDHVTFIHSTVLSMQRHQAWVVAVLVCCHFSFRLSFHSHVDVQSLPMW